MIVNKKQDKVRFGIMCGSTSFQQWQANTIQNLLKQKEIECCFLIIDKRNSSSRRIKNLNSVKINNVLWRAYLSFSRKRFKASKLVDLYSVLADIPKLECQIIKKGKFSEYFKATDTSEIKKQNLDFILRFAFGIIRGEILNAAKFGVWSFHHDDEQKYRGGPACFWEIYNNDKITGSILQRITDKLDAGIVLKKGFLRTNAAYIKNRDQMYFESSKWPTQVCANILNGNIEYLHNEPSTTKAPIYYAPTNFQFINFFLKTGLKRIRNFFREYAFADYWNIGIANAPIHSYLDENSHPSVKWFPNLPKDRFYADPFAFVDGNKLHIFYEEYLYSERKGKIAYTNYESGKFSNPQIVMNKSFHLSYPFLFKFNGDIYMVPESYEENKVILFKATDFPLQWKKEKILIDDFAGIDSTLFNYKRTWWMFTSDKNDGSSHNLNLYYADNIFDEWQSHPQNPIKTDVRSSRSAGTPFTYNGGLYRPSMDYSEKLEGSITINKVVIITKDIYQEIKYNEVHPCKNSLFPDKIHTLCETGEYTIIDGCKETFIFTNFNLLKFKVQIIVKRIFQLLGKV